MSLAAQLTKNNLCHPFLWCASTSLVRGVLCKWIKAWMWPGSVPSTNGVFEKTDCKKWTARGIIPLFPLLPFYLSPPPSPLSHPFIRAAASSSPSSSFLTAAGRTAPGLPLLSLLMDTGLGKLLQVRLTSHRAPPWKRIKKVKRGGATRR